MQLSNQSIKSALNAGVPQTALAFYGRWWQLENYLREVVYVELRAKFGPAWEQHLNSSSLSRAKRDEGNRYMASADDGEMLAYEGIADLFALIDAHWELFEPVLLPRRRWQGAVDELRDLRNRNAHCRRPHPDDVNRLEQMLRDLESGAWRFYGSYVNTHEAQAGRDAVSAGWVKGRHPTAERLIDHARKQYDVRMLPLAYSVRPWAQPPASNRVAGASGALWHASWVIGGRDVNALDLWQAIEPWRGVERGSRPGQLLVHLLVTPGHVAATFAASEDPEEVADAIGAVFDQVLTTSRPSLGSEDAERWALRWRRGSERLPRRVQVDSVLTVADPYNLEAFSIFEA